MSAFPSSFSHSAGLVKKPPSDWATSSDPRRHPDDGELELGPFGRVVALVGDLLGAQRGDRDRVTDVDAGERHGRLVQDEFIGPVRVGAPAPQYPVGLDGVPDRPIAGDEEPEILVDAFDDRVHEAEHPRLLHRRELADLPDLRRVQLTDVDRHFAGTGLFDQALEAR